MDQTAKIFVAGHQGLIGSAMWRALDSAGMPNILVQTRAQLELTQADAVDAFFKRTQPEYVVLAAGRVGGILENKTHPADFLNTNLSIQQNVFASAHRYGVRRLIFFASSCMYPRSCPQPMAESALLTGQPEPTSIAYAIAKLAGVQLCLAYNQQYGEKRFLPVIPNSAYGPNDNFNPDTGHVLSALIARFVKAKREGAAAVTLWGTGAPKREFIHADDIAAACLQLLSKDISTLEFPVNLGVGRDMSIKALAQSIAQTVGYTGELIWDTAKPDGAPRKLLDSTRIQTWGWQPTIAFEAGIQSTCDWYVTQGVNKHSATTKSA